MSILRPLATAIAASTIFAQSAGGQQTYVPVDLNSDIPILCPIFGENDPITKCTQGGRQVDPEQVRHRKECQMLTATEATVMKVIGVGRIKISTGCLTLIR